MKRKLLKIIIFIILFSSITYAYDIYSLYTPKRPYKEGDIITVIIAEEANAQNIAATKTKVSAEQNLNVKAGTGILDFIKAFSGGSSQKSDYYGNGSTLKKGELDAKISVKVIKVLDNGNLLIEGSKVVEINNENEIIEVRGIIRPSDIAHDNTIYSYKITDARITYKGNGVVNNSQKPGIITRFFNWLF